MQFKYQLLWRRILVNLILSFALMCFLDFLFHDVFNLSRAVWHWDYLNALIPGVEFIYLYKYTGALFVGKGRLDKEERKIYLQGKEIDIRDIQDVSIHRQKPLGTKFMTLWLTCGNKKYTIRSADFKAGESGAGGMWELYTWLKEMKDEDTSI